MRKKNVAFAKKLRKYSTDTENRLWHHLRAKRFDGLKFRRQEPIGNYIVDFICHEKRIIIEYDGGQHLLQKKQDQKRDEWLQGQGYKVLRFWDNEIFQNIFEVLERIYQVCQKTPSP